MSDKNEFEDDFMDDLEESGLTGDDSHDSERLEDVDGDEIEMYSSDDFGDIDFSEETELDDPNNMEGEFSESSDLDDPSDFELSEEDMGSEENSTAEIIESITAEAEPSAEEMLHSDEEFGDFNDLTEDVREDADDILEMDLDEAPEVNVTLDELTPVDGPIEAEEAELELDDIPESDAKKPKGSSKLKPAAFGLIGVAVLAASGGYYFMSQPNALVTPEVAPTVISDEDIALQLGSEMEDPILDEDAFDIEDNNIVLPVNPEVIDEPVDTFAAQPYDYVEPAEVVDPAEVVEPAKAIEQSPSKVKDEINEDQLISRISGIIDEKISSSDKSDRVADAITKLSAELTEIKKRMIEAENAVLEAEVKAEEAEAKTIDLSGRKRMPNFSVIGTSKDGMMSIIRTPSDRINIFFKGERFLFGPRRMVVSDVVDSGKIVLVGDNLFIDGTRDVSTIKKPARATKPAKKAAKRAELTSCERGEAAKGWSLTAVLPEGYLLKTPKGKFKKFATGENIPGVGIINSVNSLGDLRAGTCLIKK